MPSPWLLRPRFTTRLLLVLMVLFGALLVPFLWRLERGRQQQRLLEERQRLVEDIRRCGDYATRLTANECIHAVPGRVTLVKLRGNRSGFDFSRLSLFDKVVVADLHNTDLADLSFAANLQELRYLDISCSNVRDITPLKDLTKLEELYMGGTNVSDLSAITKLINLRYLSVSKGIETSETDRLRAALPDLKVAVIDPAYYPCPRSAISGNLGRRPSQ